MENTRKQGLVLEGGAMRGLFTAGVMDVLMENGIVFDGIVGVSAGAAFGCNYKSGQIGRTEKDPDKLREVYAIGRKAAEAKLSELKHFLHQ